MTNAPAKPIRMESAVSELVADLARLYVSRPMAIEVGSQVSDDGAVYIALRGAPEDDARLIGKAGAHVDALRVLIEAVGRARGRPHTFRLVTSDEESVIERRTDALRYDPEQPRVVLERWVAALGVANATVAVSAGAGARTELAFEFNISIPDEKWARALTKAGDFDLSLIGALGTLFRASGRQHGVRLQVNIVGR